MMNQIFLRFQSRELQSLAYKVLIKDYVCAFHIIHIMCSIQVYASFSHVEVGLPVGGCVPVQRSISIQSPTAVP